jgi:hypothetical protein
MRNVAPLFMWRSCPVVAWRPVGDFERQITDLLPGSQELEERRLYSPALDWLAGGKCLGLQLVVDLGMDVSRVERGMAEPGSDGVDVDTSA